MADTRQCILWSLKRPCRFRNGQDWEKPGATSKSLRVLHSFSRAKPGSVSGDLVVTGWSYFKEETRPLGYRISQVFAKFGGLEAVQATCVSCEANVWNDRAGKVGGCFGALLIDPDSDELQSALMGSIHNRSLQDAVGKSFLATNPLWYGFWVTSPLSQQQCALLAAILPGAQMPDAEDGRFLLALQAAMELQLSLHVQLTPLGHTDFGIYTVFPHCPRCKAFSGLRWKTVQKRIPMTCRVCGQTYVPAVNESVREDAADEELSGSLTDQEAREVAQTQAAPSHPMEMFRAADRQPPGMLNRLWRRLFKG